MNGSIFTVSLLSAFVFLHSLKSFPPFPLYQLHLMAFMFFLPSVIFAFTPYHHNILMGSGVFTSLHFPVFIPGLPIKEAWVKFKKTNVISEELKWTQWFLQRCNPFTLSMSFSFSDLPSGFEPGQSFWILVHIWEHDCLAAGLHLVPSQHLSEQPPPSPNGELLPQRQETPPLQAPPHHPAPPASTAGGKIQRKLAYYLTGNLPE